MARPPERTSSAVDDRRHQGEQLHARRARRQEAQRGVGLEHVVLHRPDDADLPDVVHHAHTVEARLLCGLGDLAQPWAEPVGSAGPREVGDVQAKLHRRNLSHVQRPTAKTGWRGR
jgi:hypothetical protein